MKIDETCAVVVTGGASGLGRAVVEDLVRHGAKVAIFDLDPEAGARAAAETGAIFCHVDVTSDASVEAGFTAARSKQGQECILVCCAGVLLSRKTVSRGQDGNLRKFPLDVFDAVMRVNLSGTFRCIVQSAAGMMEQSPRAGGERGVIVTTSSITAQDGTVGNAAYSASKAAVAGLTLPVARDLMNEGIRINSILPGFFETPMTASFGSEANADYSEIIPFPRRLGRSSEFASLTRQLIENTFMNGECVRLDGGMRLGLPRT